MRSRTDARRQNLDPDGAGPIRPRGAPNRRFQERLAVGDLVGSTDEEILQSFLELVRSWRGSPAESGLRLRRTDAALLVSILGTDRHEMERRLVAGTSCTPRTARRCRRLLLASVGAVLLGLAGVTIAASATDAQAPTPDRARTAASAGPLPRATTPVGELNEPVADTSEPVIAIAGMAVPDAGAPDGTGAAAALPASAAAALPGEPEAVVTVASIGIDLPVIAGGQPIIDQGRVAHYTAPGWEPPVRPGTPGTYWLAAHRTTHGGPFASLPDLAVGAEVRVSTDDGDYVYTVTSVVVTDLWPGDEAVYGTDPTASTILLQTCIGTDQRLLVRGTLSETASG